MNQRLTTAGKSATYSAEELAFLPAALEVLKTPAPRASRILGWTIVALFLAAAGWASLGRVDSVVVATGELQPSGSTKVIQAARGGAISALLIADGQRVRHGDALILLDPAEDDARIAQLQRALRSAESEHAHVGARITALSRARNNKRPHHTSSVQPQAYAARLRSELIQYASTRESLSSELQRAQAQHAIARANLRKTMALLPPGRERESALRQLVVRGAVARPTWLAAKESLLTLEHDQQILAERVAESALRIRLAQGALGQHHADVSAQLRREQVQANESVARLKIDLQSALKLRRETTIRAPITGTVHNLSVHTIGGVVSAGQALLEIVPADSRLIGLAHVKHEDVGFVSKTHSVEIKLAGFPFTKYGAINGRIEQIAADALVHERLGNVYPIKVGLAREHLHVEGRVVPLTPGMQLTAEVKTGERTILEFILEPVLRGLSEALRER